ncbi:MAG: bifunctional adenosylcobinamide kinase/adenosylcobinamide-phosphate guanylyltransferase, partial [Ilumatobacter sp.]
WRDLSDAAIEREAASVAAVAASRSGPTVAITNEVGLGIHPENELGRRYRDVLGRVNQIWAAMASKNLLLVAGRAVELRNPWDLLDE